jgi:hypothetical protein
LVKYGVRALANLSQSLFGYAPFAFADRFLQDHAGQIISEPPTAILELIANYYDARATEDTALIGHATPLRSHGCFL